MKEIDAVQKSFKTPGFFKISSYFDKTFDRIKNTVSFLIESVGKQNEERFSRWGFHAALAIRGAVWAHPQKYKHINKLINSEIEKIEILAGDIFCSNEEIISSVKKSKAIFERIIQGEIEESLSSMNDYYTYRDLIKLIQEANDSISPPILSSEVKTLGLLKARERFDQLQEQKKQFLKEKKSYLKIAKDYLGGLKNFEYFDRAQRGFEFLKEVISDMESDYVEKESVCEKEVEELMISLDELKGLTKQLSNLCLQRESQHKISSSQKMPFGSDKKKNPNQKPNSTKQHQNFSLTKVNKQEKPSSKKENKISLSSAKRSNSVMGPSFYGRESDNFRGSSHSLFYKSPASSSSMDTPPSREDSSYNSTYTSSQSYENPSSSSMYTPPSREDSSYNSTYTSSQSYENPSSSSMYTPPSREDSSYSSSYSSSSMYTPHSSGWGNPYSYSQSSSYPFGNPSSFPKMNMLYSDGDGSYSYSQSSSFPFGNFSSSSSTPYSREWSNPQSSSQSYKDPSFIQSKKREEPKFPELCGGNSYREIRHDNDLVNQYWKEFREYMKGEESLSKTLEDVMTGGHNTMLEGVMKRAGEVAGIDPQSTGNSVVDHFYEPMNNDSGYGGGDF